jgi:hypothetical protein
MRHPAGERAQPPSQAAQHNGARVPRRVRSSLTTAARSVVAGDAASQWHTHAVHGVADAIHPPGHHHTRGELLAPRRGQRAAVAPRPHAPTLQVDPCNLRPPALDTWWCCAASAARAVEQCSGACCLGGPEMNASIGLRRPPVGRRMPRRKPVFVSSGCRMGRWWAQLAGCGAAAAGGGGHGVHGR